MIEERIKEFTIKRTKSGKYFAVLTYESENQTLEKTAKPIGIDMGVADLVIRSDGLRFKTIRFDKIWEEKLTYWQRKFGRRRRLAKSKGVEINDAKYSQKIASSRKNYLHHISKYLIENYDVIFIEDLKTTSMM